MLLESGRLYIGIVIQDVRTMLKVFLIDDSSLIRKRLRAFLKAIGHVKVVGETATVAGSLKRIRKKKPDVVILDMRLPDGSGIDVLEGFQGGSYEPVKIVLTNYAEKPIKFYSMLSGADYFFDKSKDIGKLKAVVKQLAAA